MGNLKLVDVTKSFGTGDSQVIALDHINFTANSKELTLIVGPSGSGKSTLLTILGGLQAATSGQVLLNNRNLNTFSKKQADDFRLEHIGFILQAYSLVPYLTVKKQFDLVKRIKPENNLPPEIFSQYLERLGISNLQAKYPDQLSGGQTQRVAIARALYTNPDYILADEPTSALDSQRVDEVAKLFKSIATRDDKAVVIVTHDLRMRSYADQVYEIIDGKISTV
ncbi:MULTISPECIES: ABC transporter ATP-binding protein [Leuconostoc]|uniref:Putative hemin import ATP-binding protein HrtA n=2 Tax=Leuconostoc kimchii TaxID=136609 RepID=D5T0A9_LEUKI|nr:MULTISPECIES: ABC transporter ATP-binding protein [Leuconostoc]ADG39708.1 ABC transporter ATPase component [Leuconostoc kimchii IMSNU 11154]AEJ30431.1 ABC transporter ATPase component [Leuconostoc sp. C2]QBR47492.1 ABC transporter ATP-binding protein [Leuconostoc kimchii]